MMMARTPAAPAGSAIGACGGRSKTLWRSRGRKQQGMGLAPAIGLVHAAEDQHRTGAACPRLVPSPSNKVGTVHRETEIEAGPPDPDASPLIHRKEELPLRPKKKR